MLKYNETKGQVARITTSVRSRRTAWMLFAMTVAFVVAPLHALIPPQYSDNDNYRAKGDIKSIVVKMFDAVDKIDHIEVGAMQEHPVIVEYSESGNQSRVVELNQKGDILFYFTAEEKDGQPSTQKRYSNKEWMEAYSTMDYNKGKLQSETVYNADGELSYTEVYTYNKAGQLLNVTRRNARGEKVQTVEYAYDEAGHCTLERMKSKDDRFVYQRNMIYDAQGRLSGEEYQSQEGILKSKTVYTYNAQGDIDHVRQGVPGGAVSTTKITYEYDARNNWIRCVLYASDYIPTTIIARQIEYR